MRATRSMSRPLLIIELDGPKVEVDELIGRVETIARGCGSITLQISNSEQERLLFWSGRKAAFPAVGRLSPDYLCMVGTIPRASCRRHWPVFATCRRRMACASPMCSTPATATCIPLILYDANIPEEMDKAEAFGSDILRLCVKLGGVLTRRAWRRRREARPDARDVQRTSISRSSSG